MGEDLNKKINEVESKGKTVEIPQQERVIPIPTQSSQNQMIPAIPSMTFARTVTGRRGEKEKGAHEKHPEAVETTDKPRFLNPDHEKDWELNEGKKKIIIRVERTDFETEVEGYDPEMSDDFILKNPVTYGARLAGIKNKIYNATGIMPWKLDVKKISISTKRVKLAWVSFGSARTVNDIFRLMVQNGNTTGFHAFPHVPGKAMAQKTAIENILKRLQSINKSLRYQIRLGKKDLEILVKEHKDFDWKPYRRIELEHIDLNNEVPDWDLVSRSCSQPTNAVNPFDAEKQAGKRGPIESPEGRRSKRSNIDDFQVLEFVWAYLEGTATQPRYANLNWELEASREDAEVDTEGEEGDAETDMGEKEAEEIPLPDSNPDATFNIN